MEAHGHIPIPSWSNETQSTPTCVENPSAQEESLAPVVHDWQSLTLQTGDRRVYNSMASSHQNLTRVQEQIHASHWRMG